MPFSDDEEPIKIACRGLVLHEEMRASAMLGGFVEERYEIVDLLGAGASGIVYAARDVQIGRLVALKILRPDLASNPVAAERLRREARVLGGIRHENLVAVHDTGRFGDRPFIVMEMVQGKTLAELLAEKDLDLVSKIEIVAAAARGVAAVHAHGIVHRDLKPSNILVGDDGRVRVADFGHSSFCDRTSDLTCDGARLGTPAFMAPECMLGQAADFSSDVYSLGAVLYEAVTGCGPHADGPPGTFESSRCRDEPTAPRVLNPSISADLEAVSLRAVDRDRARRYASASLFADDLDRILEERSPIARPLSPLRKATRIVARRKRFVGVAAVVLLAAIVATQAMLNARRVATRAETERTRREAARRSFDLAREDLRAAREIFKKGRSFDDRVRERMDRAAAEISAGRLESRDDPWGPALLGESAWIRGDRAEAERRFSESLALDPHFTPAHKSLGRLLVECAFIETMQCEISDRREAGGQAAALATRARRHLVASLEGLSGRDADLTRTLAEMAAAQIEHRCADVQELYRRGEEKFRGEPDAGLIAWLAAICRKNDRRLELLDRALLDEPRHPLILLGRAVALHDLGRLSEALATLDLALEVDEGLLCLHVARALILAESGKTRAAEESAKALIEKFPHSIDPLMVSAQLSVVAGRFPAALRALDAVLALNHGCVPALINRSNIRRMQGDDRAALADLDRAAEAAPDEPIVREARGHYFLDIGDRERARQEFDRAVTAKNAPPSVFSGRALIALEDGRIARATELVEEALRRDPSDVGSLFLRGGIREGCGQFELAYADFIEAEKYSRRLLCGPSAISRIPAPFAPCEKRLR